MPPLSRRSLFAAVTAAAASVAAGCGDASNQSSAQPAPRAGQGQSTGQQGAPPSQAQGAAGSSPEPERIQVQHILIGFTGSVPGKNITRTPEQARTLAYDLLQRARGGADFDALVRQHTDDQAPGIYAMANRGVRPNPGEFPREGMVAAFGDVGFRLRAGEYGVADYDPRTSPFGYHVIKRLK